MEAVSRENGMKFSCVTNPSFEDYVNNDCKLYIAFITLLLLFR